MTDNNEDKQLAAFRAGFRAARHRGNPNKNLGPVTERTIDSMFKTWSKND
jgi:hypothetical protein